MCVCVQVIQGIVDRHTDVFRSLKGVSEVESALEASASGLTERIAVLMPWHAEADNLELPAAAGFNAWEADKLHVCIDALVKYDSKVGGGGGTKYASVDSIFKGGIRAVIRCLNREVDASLPSHDGKVQTERLDKLGIALRKGARLKKEHARLYSLGLTGDFVSAAVQKLGNTHAQLKSALELGSEDAGKTEDLLKTVRALSSLDDAIENQDYKFDALYRQYEALLREKMDGHVNEVVELVVYVCVCIHTHTHAHTYIHIYIYIHTYIYTYHCICVCVCTCVCVCVCRF